MQLSDERAFSIICGNQFLLSSPIFIIMCLLNNISRLSPLDSEDTYQQLSPRDFLSHQTYELTYDLSITLSSNSMNIEDSAKDE